MPHAKDLNKHKANSIVHRTLLTASQIPNCYEQITLFLFLHTNIRIIIHRYTKDKLRSEVDEQDEASHIAI